MNQIDDIGQLTWLYIHYFLLIYNVVDWSHAHIENIITITSMWSNQTLPFWRGSGLQGELLTCYSYKNSLSQNMPSTKGYSQWFYKY